MHIQWSYLWSSSLIFLWYYVTLEFILPWNLSFVFSMIPYCPILPPTSTCLYRNLLPCCLFFFLSLVWISTKVMYALAFYFHHFNYLLYPGILTCTPDLDCHLPKGHSPKQLSPSLPTQPTQTFPNLNYLNISCF